MSTRRIAITIFCVLVLAVTGRLAKAQGIITGSIAGTVQDNTGAVISGANIVARNVQTGLETTAATTKNGDFNLPDMPVGDYIVTVSSSGFGQTKFSGVTVRSGVSTSIGTVKLSISATESVEVSTAPATLETTQAQLTTTFDNVQITDLPTGGGLDRVALLIPGVVRTLGNNYANTNGTGLSSNGLRGRSNNFEVDGQTNNDNSVSGPQFFFHNEDAIQQIQIVTNNFGAQYGRNAGQVVNYITNSGTNSYHGTAFENYVGSWGSSLLPSQKDPLFGFCAPGQTTSCTAVTVPRVTANEFGGVIGGPILKDKLFFFGAILQRLVTNGASPSISTSITPTPTGLTQLQAAFPNNPFVTSLANQGPYSVKPGNPVPGTTTSNVTVCAAAVTTCPAGSPSVQFGTIVRFLPSTSSDREILGRIDYQLTHADRFFIRYMYQNSPTNVSGGTVSSGAYYNTADITHSVGADWTHTFSPNWVNQLRYGFQQAVITFGGGGYPTCVDASIINCASNVATTGYTTYGPATNIPQGRVVKVTQVQDNATWSFGKHGITLGGEWAFQNSPNTFLPYTSGGYAFNNFNYGLAGNTTLTLANGSPNIPFREPDIALYFQDDWRVTPSLTLNLGLRWEYFQQGINVLHTESVARQTGPNPIWLTTLPLSLTTFPYIPEAYKNFQPRIGFAYNPSSHPNLVIRGGFAINYDPAFYNIFLNSYTSAPVVNTGVIPCDGVTVACLPSGGTINALVHQQNDQYNPTGVNPGTKVVTTVAPNFRNPYVENYTLGIQHSIKRFAVGEIRYVGNHAVNQFQTINGNPNLNAAPPAASVPATLNYQTLAQAFPARYSSSSYCTTAGAVGLGRVDCNHTYVTSRGNTAYSIYNALQLNLQLREFHGLSGNVAYTWSRTVDNTSEVYSGGSSGGNTIAVAQNPFDTSVAERGLSGDSYPNVTSLGLVYRLPFYKDQSGVIGHLLGGFSLNTIYTFNSGQPYTPYQSTKAAPNAAALAKIPTANQGQALYSFCDYYYNSGVLAADSCRPILANPHGAPGTVALNGGPGVGYIDFATGASVSRTQDKWLLNNQYEAEALGNPFPGVGRNTLKGNTVNELDMSVFKTVRITERVSAQLRLNVFNLPNRLYLGNPDPLITDANPAVHNPNYASFENYQANGGTIVGTAFGKGCRNIELGGKIIF
jgi:Carboxypeptidase regulatory-like domain/TonB dependent receptor/TonB-dependent Receptor Plug Domain